LRHFLAFLVSAGALVAAAGGTSAPTAVEARACVQRASFFNVELLGDKDATRWSAASARPLSAVPDQKTVAVVWSLGGPVATSGMAVYSWMTDTRSRFAFQCTRSRAARKNSTRGLRAPVRVKDGWNLTRRFACLQRGRLLVAVRDIAGGGKRMTVRMERTGEVIAVAEVKRGGGSLRGSTRCDERS
jgi:hypothetical protein